MAFMFKMSLIYKLLQSWLHAKSFKVFGVTKHLDTMRERERESCSRLPNIHVYNMYIYVYNISQYQYCIL